MARMSLAGLPVCARWLVDLMELEWTESVAVCGSKRAADCIAPMLLTLRAKDGGTNRPWAIVYVVDERPAETQPTAFVPVFTEMIESLRAPIRSQLDKGEGAIVLVSPSGRSQIGAIVSAGVGAFAKSLAREVARSNVTVNVVQRTDGDASLTSEGSQWKAVAEMTDFLISAGARYITGQLLPAIISEADPQHEQELTSKGFT